jgi:hypothetical protein
VRPRSEARCLSSSCISAGMRTGRVFRSCIGGPGLPGGP